MLAAVSFPIIGDDFLRHFGLMVDPAANTLVDKCSAESFATVSALTAAASADSGPPPAAQLTGPQSLVLSHQSSFTGPQSPVLSHRSPVTAIATPFGLFKFLRMTFGLRNAGNTFQRLMDRILAGLNFVFVYLDDVIIGSGSMSEHLQHVRILFQRLQAVGLVINREKCVFGVPEVDFLGHHVSAAGVLPIASRVTAINDHPRPTTVKEFLGRREKEKGSSAS